VTLEDGTDRLFRNVGNYQSKLRNVQEGRGAQLEVILKGTVTSVLSECTAT
jgi:hypothetical protein